MMKRQTLFCAAVALALAAPASQPIRRAGVSAGPRRRLHLYRRPIWKPDVLAIDEGVLESPLSAEERAAVQQYL